ncbi:DMT family transporter [Mesorhizobium sp. BAC0120]|uniref:DMT family transporter n=1 Tax=Mesorhizobium sp. BAC0120 TaxID=3090670 RepID=UPI00298C8510|nr:DMT family transporter [Mesorhizobium sp. BAC0120]MDW6023541.1 DMT family transporter [Mesorhizobium sp. BAC0120]
MISEILAVAAALCAALSSMFISELKGRVPLLQLARWQMTAAFVMTGLISLSIGGWRSVGLWQFGFLAASSFFGIAIASTTYFAAIYSVGPRITALLFSLTSPFALTMGYIALGETITFQQALGVAFVLCGIVLAIGTPRRFITRGSSAPAMPVITPSSIPVTVAPKPPLKGPLFPGVVLGVVTAFGQALGTLFARPAMASGVEPFTAMAVRSGLAALFFLAILALPIGRAGRAAFQPGALGLAIGSAFFGMVLGMSLLMAALHEGEAGIVATLSSITPVLILPMVWIRSREPPSRRAWFGAGLAVLGTALISI